MQIDAYLFFNGQCEAAFKFYEQCLGGKIEAMLTHGDSPMKEEVEPDWRGKILHARLVVDGRALLGSDVPPQHFRQPEGFSVSLNIDAAAEADRIFHALAEQGKVTMPIQKTFWAGRFGMLVDRFEIPWMINCDKAE